MCTHGDGGLSSPPTPTKAAEISRNRPVTTKRRRWPDRTGLARKICVQSAAVSEKKNNPPPFPLALPCASSVSSPLLLPPPPPPLTGSMRPANLSSGVPGGRVCLARSQNYLVHPPEGKPHACRRSHRLRCCRHPHLAALEPSRRLQRRPCRRPRQPRLEVKRPPPSIEGCWPITSSCCKLVSKEKM